MLWEKDMGVPSEAAKYLRNMFRLHLPRDRRLAREMLYKVYMGLRDFEPEYFMFGEPISADLVYLPAEEMHGVLGCFRPFQGNPPHQHRMEILDGLPFWADIYIKWHEIAHWLLVMNGTTAGSNEPTTSLAQRAMEAMCDGVGEAVIFWQAAEVELVTRSNLAEFFTFGVEQSFNTAEVHVFRLVKMLYRAQALEPCEHKDGLIADIRWMVDLALKPEGDA